MSRLAIAVPLLTVLLTVAVQAQVPCETKVYYDTQLQEVVYQENLPTSWFGIKMDVEWIATVDTAIISFGIEKAAGSGPHALDVRILKDTLPTVFVLDQMTLGLVPDINGKIPDGKYIVEFLFQQPLAWIDPPGSFWLTWRLRGPSTDIGRIMVTKPAIAPTRSVVINTNGSTTLMTDHVSAQIQDSVDLCAEAHVCYPYGIPVELQSFTVAYQNGAARLRWQTASETDNFGFEIERLVAESKVVKVWQRIGFVPGNGSTTQLQEYSFTDPRPELSMDEQGVVRYRLRQLDYDGTSSRSPVALLYIPSTVAGFALDQNYPNPVPAHRADTKIGFTLPQASQVRLALYDGVGREVGVAAEGLFSGGYHSVPFHATLPAGVYFYTLTSGDQRITRRMTVVD